MGRILPKAKLFNVGDCFFYIMHVRSVFQGAAFDSDPLKMTLSATILITWIFGIRHIIFKEI